MYHYYMMIFTVSPSEYRKEIVIIAVHCYVIKFVISECLEHSALSNISRITHLGTDTKAPNLHKGATRCGNTKAVNVLRGTTHFGGCFNF